MSRDCRSVVGSQDLEVRRRKFHRPAGPKTSHPPQEARMTVNRWIRPVLAVLFISALLSAPRRGAAEETVYPHNTRIVDCTLCHTEDIYTEDCHERDGFCLTAKTVDDLCLHCHMKEECCRIGREHQAQLFLGVMNHPSNIRVRDVDRANRPETLPIHGGRITCRTCHRHTRAQGADYKLLRLVNLDGRKHVWTVLCMECHEDKG